MANFSERGADADAGLVPHEEYNVVIELWDELEEMLETHFRDEDDGPLKNVSSRDSRTTAYSATILSMMGRAAPQYVVFETNLPKTKRKSLDIFCTPSPALFSGPAPPTHRKCVLQREATDDENDAGFFPPILLHCVRLPLYGGWKLVNRCWD